MGYQHLHDVDLGRGSHWFDRSPRKLLDNDVNSRFERISRGTREVCIVPRRIGD